MRRLVILIVLSSNILFLSAQSLTPQVIASAGGYYLNSHGSLSVTIGQPSLINTAVNPNINLILTQGFQQPENFNLYPLQLVEFNGSKKKDDAELKWKVQNEVAIKSYGVQKSTDGKTFTTIGNVAAYNNRRPENNYSYTDKNVEGTVYYRLLIREADGKENLSWIVMLKGVDEQVQVYPMPVTKLMNVQLFSAGAGNRNMQLFTASGKLIWTRTAVLQAGYQTLVIDLTNEPIGTYILKGLTNQSVMIIKQ